MNKRWAPGFTIVELIIVITVIALLAVVSFVTYNGSTKNTRSNAAKSDLTQLASVMEQQLQNNNAYPTSVPSDFQASANVNLTIASSTNLARYNSLTAVQNGVLFASVCQRLIDQGVGKGTAQDGTIRDYITGCGNWNHNSVQITAWQTQVWNTPVQEATLTQYAQNFTAPSTWDADQKRVVQTFYTRLVNEHKLQGGTFPITSFWDYWATPDNGGVTQEQLDPTVTARPDYCAQATVNGYSDIIWHITRGTTVQAGPCT